MGASSSHPNSGGQTEFQRWPGATISQPLRVPLATDSHVKGYDVR